MDALTRLAARTLLVGLTATVAGCLGTTPLEARRDRIGDDPPEGPTHNPGNDCLACHDFAVAGTVYLRASDAEGLGGVRVTLTDAVDRTFEAVTNRAGNFFVEVESGDRSSFDDEGRARVGFVPTFPLRVRMSSGDLEAEMITSIHRQGSCNTCHDRLPGAASVGRVYLVEEP